ncbi:NlpC/P60 family protein [Maribacter sp. 2307ULW6-5]|uniref:C40 family peptidase n=1 Tax=Maribacter sp. 2307ULW6-5 TaxID=3386275 RepID=UPI0039BC856B
MNHSYAILCIIFIIALGCDPTGQPQNKAQEIIDNLKGKVAPDKRVAVFNIAAQQQGNGYVLKGETNDHNALQRLYDSLAANAISFTDSVSLLPRAELGEKTRALINISVANLRSRPKHSAELATQATLGTPVKVLKKEGDWYYIQTPDHYLAWVDDGGIVLLTEQEIKNWESAEKMVYTKTYGHAYLGPERKEVVSDLVAGNILEVIKYADSFYIVRFPDGRNAYISHDEAMKYEDWLANLDQSSAALVATSKRFMGVPYLWGGTSAKGMDCSGFTKTIFFLNGMVIPRDASQQVHTGEMVDEKGNFDALEEGDLLFFGTEATADTPEKVVHVGMWIGNNEFIHASDMVRIGSVDKTAPNYDEHNVDRYLRSKRLLRKEDKDLLDLRKVPLFR